MHFEGTSAVHRTLRRLVHRLEDLGVDYVIAGGLAFFFHGYRRFYDLSIATDGRLLCTTIAATRRVVGPSDLSNRGYLRLANCNCIVSSLARGSMDE